jgi:uncharacterized cupredoxin-like copper-binding protein
MIRLARAVSAVALVGLLLACGSDSKPSGQTVNITITDKGCEPSEVTVAKGTTTFHVKNDGADQITEFEILDGSKIVGEKENLTPGLSADVTVDLASGEYVLACPGGTEHPTGTLTVTETGAAPAGSHSDHEVAEGCVPAGTSESPSTHVKVALKDFDIQLDPGSVSTGAIALDGTNGGTHPHEIVIVKGVAPAGLPTASDGKVDEDKLPDGALIGEVEAFNPGVSCSGTFALTTGTYTLFCNIVGDEGSHYKLGMVTTFTVK